MFLHAFYDKTGCFVSLVLVRAGLELQTCLGLLGTLPVHVPVAGCLISVQILVLKHCLVLYKCRPQLVL